MKWIPLIAVGIYVISMLLVLFLGNRVKGTPEDKEKKEKNERTFAGIYERFAAQLQPRARFAFVGGGLIGAMSAFKFAVSFH